VFFWDVIPCIMVKFSNVSEQQAASLTYNDDGGRRFLQNADIFLPNYFDSHSRKWQPPVTIMRNSHTVS
jgi:hypothetical protein